MKKAFLKMTVLGAACSMLAASGWAQSESQNQGSNDSPANRSWSTKHLSATGRDGEHSLRATQLSGATVNNSSGQRVATVEDTIIDPASGRVQFALLSLNGAAEKSSSSYSGDSNSSSARSSVSVTSSSPNKLVPVPWSILKMASGSSQYSSSTEKPTFTLSVDQNKLDAAPSVSASDLNQSEWQQRVYAYYGVTPSPAGTPPSMGASESPAGQIKGEGARRMENTTPDRQQPTTP